MYSIIHDHNDFLLISKHPGISFHKNDEQEGLTHILKKDLGITELYTVHRLDTITSGLLLFAKNRRTAQSLARQFSKRKIDKYYLAVSDRRPNKKQGLIRGDMVKARRGAWKLTRTSENPAVTHFFSSALEDGLRLFLVKPYTGKTHQIRVALKSIGSPLLGDPLYHGKEAGGKLPDRAYLHCYALRFWLNKVRYEFIHKPDIGIYFTNKAFQEALKKFAVPWNLDWPSILPTYLI